MWLLWVRVMFWFSSVVLMVMLVLVRCMFLCRVEMFILVCWNYRFYFGIMLVLVCVSSGQWCRLVGLWGMFRCVSRVGLVIGKICLWNRNLEYRLGQWLGLKWIVIFGLVGVKWMVVLVVFSVISSLGWVCVSVGSWGSSYFSVKEQVVLIFSGCCFFCVCSLDSVVFSWVKNLCIIGVSVVLVGVSVLDLLCWNSVMFYNVLRWCSWWLIVFWVICSFFEVEVKLVCWVVILKVCNVVVGGRFFMGVFRGGWLEKLVMNESL